MSLGLFALALYIFLQSAGYLAWFAVTPGLLGFIGMITVVLLIIEGGPVLYKRYVVRQP